MKYKCYFCTYESDINFYYYDGKIISTDYPLGGIEYHAEIRIKGICPVCGKTLCDKLTSEITHRDIVKLVIGKAVNNAQM